MSTCQPERYPALVQWMEENQAAIYRFAYSYVKNRDTALDMVQESIYKAIKNYETLKNADSIRPWFYRIVVNTCLDELRRGSRVTVTAPEDLPEEGEDSLATRADILVLRQALDRLDGKTKTVIVLRYFEDRKLSEIAEILEENVNSVKSRLYRGLRALQVEMGQEVWKNAE
ncbi:MAG: RNA polymerase sigma factor [Oscillospiraceae bacterium]